MGLRDELAQALYALGRYEEAKAMSEESERQSASDDLQSQVHWRALAREAVAIAEATEFILVHANALIDLGEPLRLAGRPGAALPCVEGGRRLFERKGDRGSAMRAEVVLTELERDSAAQVG